MTKKVDGKSPVPGIIFEEIQVSTEEFARIEADIFPPVRDILDFDGQFEDMIVFGQCSYKVEKKWE